MNAHPANTVFRAINAMRPKQKYRLGLGDWDAATPEQRAAMDLWCAAHGYELVIDLNDLGPMNDRVSDMEPTRDFDKERERDNQDDYETFPAQAAE